MTTPVATRTAILQEIEERLVSYRQRTLQPAGFCVPAARLAIDVARKHGISLVLQAGSAKWPRTLPGFADGGPTNYGYTWRGLTPTVIERVQAGALPELHCWCVVKGTDEIVDPTAGEFPMQAACWAGIDWPGPQPPIALWALRNSLPPGTEYKADINATALVAQLISTAYPQFSAW